MNRSLSIDITLSLVSAYATIRGTTAPFVAEKESTATDDWIRKLGLTRISTLYHVILLIATSFQCHKIMQLHKSLPPFPWQGGGAQQVFRLMNVVNILGGLLRVVCFRVLGHYFTFDLAVQKGQKVITTGPYAFVRHPSYTAMILHQVGTAFSMAVYGPMIPPRWRERSAYINAALTVFAISMISLRIKDEEKMLTRELGPEYKKYMVRVRSRLIPYLL